MEKIVVVGASLAGLSAVKELRREGFSGAITVIGAEPERPYDRPPLSKQLLVGSYEPVDLDLEIGEDLDGVHWRTGVTAVGLDPVSQLVHVDQGEPESYDGLIVATGARPRSMPGSTREGVFTLRTREDALALRAALLDGSPRVAIVGGGFIGAEVAASCRSLGLDVTVIEAAGSPMGAVLGDMVGSALATMHRDHGVSLRLDQGVEELYGDDRVRGVRLVDGSTVTADIVVLAIGVIPNTEWLEGSGLTLENGVVCDASCLAAPGVVAAGDVARWPNELLGEFRRVEHWDNAIRQGEHAARRLLADPLKTKHSGYEPVPWVWSDQFDRKFQIMGTPAGHDEARVAVGDLNEKRFLVLYRKGEYLAAVFGANQARAVLGYREKIRSRMLWSEALAEFDLALEVGQTV